MSRVTKKCRVCGHAARFVKNVRGEETGRPIALFRCPKCACFLARLDFDCQSRDDIRSESIDHYVANEDYLRRRVGGLLARATEKGWVAPVDKNYLDIGCGVGWSLLVARDMGFETFGIEPMLPAATYASNTLGVNVAGAFFSPELFPGISFDLIVMDQVLEHVPQPRAVLQDVVERLKPGGILFLGVPPIDWSRRLLSASLQLPIGAMDRLQRLGRNTQVLRALDRYDAFNVPEGHITYFSVRGIKQLADECGAEILEQYHTRRTRAMFGRLLGLSTGSFFLGRKL